MPTADVFFCSIAVAGESGIAIAEVHVDGQGDPPPPFSASRLNAALEDRS